VEDTHLIVQDAIIILNPGAISRSKEPPSLASHLPKDRPIFSIPDEHTIDGGVHNHSLTQDILQVHKTIFVGLSHRTTLQAVNSLRSLLNPFGYKVVGLQVPRGLHLKSGLTAVTPTLFVALKGFEFPEIQELGSRLGFNDRYYYLLFLNDSLLFRLSMLIDLERLC
jgi:N-dimethylarginine dimethylaminohydrolase